MCSCHWLKSLGTPDICCCFKRLNHFVVDNKVLPHACAITLLHPRCEEGYELATQMDSLSCQSDGSWSKHSVRCRPLPCPLPANFSIPHLVITGKELTPVGGSITLSCPPGFYLQGSALSECQVGTVLVNHLSNKSVRFNG